jgi:hypothetical protein
LYGSVPAAGLLAPPVAASSDGLSVGSNLIVF